MNKAFTNLLAPALASALMLGCATQGPSPSGSAIGTTPTASLQNAESVSPTDFVVQQPPQRAGMHACMRGPITPIAPDTIVGRVVTGIRADRNELLCTFPLKMGPEVVQAAIPNTREVRCPRDHFVTGVRADRLQALCAPILSASMATVAIGSGFADPVSPSAPPTQRRGMHACPYGSGITGFVVDAGAWTFTCAEFPVCWYFNAPPSASPCTNRCDLPPGSGSRQGTCR